MSPFEVPVNGSRERLRRDLGRLRDMVERSAWEMAAAYAATLCAYHRPLAVAPWAQINYGAFDDFVINADWLSAAFLDFTFQVVHRAHGMAACEARRKRARCMGPNRL